MESILTSVKKMLGITEEYTPFDPELIMFINSVFTTLKQLGVGPAEGYMIEDESNTWDEFVMEGDLEAVKSYVYLKVRLIFDPPMNSSVLSSFQEMTKELEWRMNVMVEEEH